MHGLLEVELYSEARGTGENRPYFGNESRVLEKYWEKVEPGLKGYLEKHLSYVPSFREIGIEVVKLPTFYALTGEGIAPVAKIWGAYEPDSQKMYLDPAIFEELEDPERKALEKYGLKGKAEDILVHELVHHVQRSLGSIYVQPRDFVEGVATKVTEDITGRTQTAYPDEKEKVEDLSKYFSPDELLKGAKKISLN